MTDVARDGEEASDLALIERWRAGDERAATALVERHAAALARFAASLGVWDDTDELVQDTFVRAFGSLQSFRHDASLRTWLFTILRRLVLDRRRAARRDRSAVPLEQVELATDHGALDGMLADEAEVRMGRAVQGLTRLQREVFTLRVSEGASYREIAEVLGTTEGAARVHYHNAVRAVKEALDD
jgi:RNA polymerase sigma-70 factor (ECF subfamily)